MIFSLFHDVNRPRRSPAAAAGTIAVLLVFPTTARAADSVWVKTGVTGRLMYVPDPQGDRIMDFSGVGYRGRGVEALPSSVAPVVTIGPAAGDDTARIQAALNQVAALPVGPDGYRGAVQLLPGDYDIVTKLTIAASGVVLSGAGRDAGGTVLHGRGAGQRSLIEIVGAGSQTLTGSARNMTDKVVPVGATSFCVDSTSGLAVGDTVRVTRPTPANWISDLGMDMLPPRADGGTVNQWTETTLKLRYDRVITRIEGDRVFLDAPLPQSFDQSYGGGTIRKYAWSGRIENVGIENLQGSSDFISPTDEDHAWNFISVDSAQNVWVRNTRSKHFGRSAVLSNPGTKWLTVDNAINESPVSLVTGSRRYTYDLSGELELVTGSSASEGRHDFVNNSTQPGGPHVFHNSVAYAALDESGPHQRWATGTLLDNVTVHGDQINARNRGNFGTGHGWAGANMVVWNSTAESFIVQNPPTAQNWLVGSRGAIIQDGTFGPQPPGYYDQSGPAADPVIVGGTASLYEAQRNDARDVTQFHALPGAGSWDDAAKWQQGLAPSDTYRISSRDYLVGDIDNFQFDGAGSVDEAAIDPAWQSAVAAATGLPVTGFDDLAGDRSVAFTIQHALDPGERIVHGYLAAALKQGAVGSVADDYLQLFDTSPEHKLAFADLQWTNAVNSSEAFVGVADLGPFLDELQDGSVNVQLGDSTAMDWAMYVAAVATPRGDASGAHAFVDGGASVVIDASPPPIKSVTVGGAGPGELILEAPASLQLGEDLTLSSASSLTIGLDAPIGASGRIDAGGAANLAGTLTIALDESLTPFAGLQVALISALTINGQFDDVHLPPLAPELAWSLAYEADLLRLDVRLSGDFDGDGVVGPDDLAIWQGNVGATSAVHDSGDANGDGRVDGGDFLLWQQQLGSAAPSPIAGIPEPGAGFLTLLGIAGALGYRPCAIARR